jgi:hypothetical protein
MWLDAAVSGGVFVFPIQEPSADHGQWVRHKKAPDMPKTVNKYRLTDFGKATVFR